MDPRSILVELLRKFLPIGNRQYHSLFFVCGFEDSYALASKLEVIGHKHLILRLTDHDRYSQMLSINLWEELQRLFCYRQHVSIFQALKGDSVGYWTLSENHTGVLKYYFSKQVESWLLIIFSKIFEAIGKMLTHLDAEDICWHI